jgi:hypothetical protein
MSVQDCIDYACLFVCNLNFHDLLLCIVLWLPRITAGSQVMFSLIVILIAVSGCMCHT